MNARTSFSGNVLKKLSAFAIPDTIDPPMSKYVSNCHLGCYMNRLTYHLGVLWQRPTLVFAQLAASRRLAYHVNSDMSLGDGRTAYTLAFHQSTIGAI